MPFQVYQGEMNLLVGHEIPGAEEGAQMMQLLQVQLVQAISSAVSQALTQQMQRILQQVQLPIKFDVPIYDSAASWLRSSQKVLYQARACGFEAELTAAEGEGLGLGAGVFDESNVDPVRLRNTHVV